MRYLGGVCAAWVALTGAAFAEEGVEQIGDPVRGAELFQVCGECHEVGTDAAHKVGPVLNGIFFRKVAVFEDFEYSDGIRRARRDGMVWDLEHLDAYLNNPKALVSGTNMVFAGMPEAKDRGDVLAYLRQFSDSPQDIPEAAPTAKPVDVSLTPETLAIVGDPDYGEYLSSECTTCHQVDGDYDGIPAIIGWYDEDFVLAMHAYKQKIRPHPVMQMLAGRLSDEEIAALAAYFGALE
ncbi:c-type cytochrome [Phaeobacter marinintestinus]|uniref:c-type cytochrome n=1 Tax=Falsiphaeobacter marinintestinus TaxID=1492905 RepID=UPI0011B465B2|nr:c-type cytochrome [Phaeobacter marinintestinus]